MLKRYPNDTSDFKIREFVQKYPILKVLPNLARPIRRLLSVHSMVFNNCLVYAEWILREDYLS